MNKYPLTGKFKRALVTGGAGFIGSNFVESLLEDGLEVLCVDNYTTGKPENLVDIKNKFKSQLSIIEFDILDKEKLAPYFKGVDVVFHLACSKMTYCMINPAKDLLINAQGTLNLLELSVENNIQKFVHVSTGSVYGNPKYFPTDENHPVNPTSFYGISKLAGEKYARVFTELYDLDVSILRYYHVYGPKQDAGNYGGVIAIFSEKALKNEDLTIFGDGHQIRSFTYVKDIININKLVALKGQKGEAYNCASGLKVSINDMAHSIIKHLNSSSKIIYQDWKPGDIKFFEPSHEKLKALGFEFEYLHFEKGLLETIKWYQKKGLQHV